MREVKNSRIGLAKIRTGEGWIMENISLYHKNGHYWIGFPSFCYGEGDQKKWCPHTYRESPEHQKELVKQITDAVVAKMKAMGDHHEELALPAVPADFGSGLFF